METLRKSARARAFALALVGVGTLAALGGVLVAGPAAAQIDPDPTTTTTTSTVVEPTSTTTTIDAAATTTTVPGSPDTTVPVVPVGPPTSIPADPLAASTESLSDGGYSGQPAFDLGSMAVIAAEVKRAAATLKDAQARLAVAQAALDAANARLTAMTGEIAVTGQGRAEQVANAAKSKENLRRRAVQAYLRSGRDLELIMIVGDPMEYSRANRYLETLAGLDRRALAEYRAGVAQMSSKERRLVDDQSGIERRITDLTTERDKATQAVLDAQRCLTARQLGTRACAPGFVFPVLGDVNFYDSWGAARLPGTPQAHWHEGTDIMAPMGREIVATENGMLFKVGSAGLGGQRLWLHGESGTEYYYAHFSAFAPGIADGLYVTAGTVVGYVGNTGDAAGGPTHLHFEVHPLGGRPVDPYPLLKAAWGRRIMPSELAALAGVPTVTGALPPEEQ